MVNDNYNNRVSSVSIAFYNMNHTSLPAHLSCFCVLALQDLKTLEVVVESAKELAWFC